MLVGRRMTPDPKTVGPDDLLSRAAGIMREHRIHHLPVAGEGGKLVGILSDADIRNASLAAGEAHGPGESFLQSRRVRDVMKTEVWSLTPEASVEDALQILTSRRFGCLPILAGEKVVGIITKSDLLRAFADVLNVGEVCACLDVALPRTLDRFEAMIGEVRALGVGLRSCTATPHKESDRVIARLRLDTLDAQRVAGVLRAKGYDVRERADAL